MFWDNWKQEKQEDMRLIELEKDIRQLKRDVLDISVSIDSLRDKILKRIKVRKEEETKSKDIYNGMLIAE